MARAKKQGEVTGFSAEVDAAEFAKALSLAGGVTNAKSPDPASTVVVLTAGDGKVGIRARSSLGEVVLSVPAKSVASGSAAVDAKDLASAMKYCTGPTSIGLVQGQRTDPDVVVLSGARSYVIRRTRPASDVPDPMDLKAGVLARPMKLATLKRLLAAALPTASTDFGRPHLCGVGFEVEDDHRVAVATDGHALVVVRGDESSGDGVSFFVPTDAARVLKDVFVADGEDDEVAIEVAPGRVRFTHGGRTFVASSPDVTIPNWKGVVPKSHVFAFNVPTDVLASSAEAASIALPRHGAIVIDATGERVKVRTDVSDAAFSDEIDVEPAGKGRVPVGVNASYLIRAMKAAATCGAASVAVRFGGPLDPVRIDADGFTGVVMPVTI